MAKVTEELMEFINQTPNAYNCVENLKDILKQSGYLELFEYETWNNLKGGKKYFTTRGDSSLIAFTIPTKKEEGIGFNITATHTDSPSFSIKTNPRMENGNYIQLNIEGYGAMINHTWLDRPLSIAGRVICKDKNGTIIPKIINVDKDLLIVPSQAIHIDREVNQKNHLNHQIDMIPILSLNNSSITKESFLDLLLKEIDDSNLKILDYDLYLYNRDPAKICGKNSEFLLAPRLDDLACLYPALKSFINSNNPYSINILSTLNNEEIGSGTKQGADSNFLLDTLTRIAKGLEIDLLPALSNSFIVSADNAHATHPNASSKSDPTNKVELNKGIVVKHHTNYTTDSLTSSLFKEVCNYSNVPYQDFACRSDMICGKTLGGISTSHVGINSVDIGLAQLAMHSATETMGSEDPEYLYQALKEFYSIKFEQQKNTIKIRRK